MSSSIPASSINSNTGGGELFEKYQRQKLSRESTVNAGVSSIDTWVDQRHIFVMKYSIHLFDNMNYIPTIPCCGRLHSFASSLAALHTCSYTVLS